MASRWTASPAPSPNRRSARCWSSTSSRPPRPPATRWRWPRQPFAEGRFGEAEAQLKALLAKNNENAAALILYARCLAERGELGEAEAMLDAVKSDEHKQALAGARAQLTFLRQAADLPDSAELKSRLAADAGDDEAAYQLAVQQLARQQYEAALDGLLKLFLRNRGYQDDLPRKTLVQVFDLLGNDHPLVTAYRRKLANLLY